ncbi:MAG: SurA N-terminal domain-containing protein [Rickettsiales bacterium]|nr:SurA N-terminal domain-containing protein [Rickettsiales bacterium]
MLRELRKVASGFLAKLLLLLLALSLGIWGIGDVVRQSGPQNIATVGDDEVSLVDFSQQISLLRRTFGESMPSSGVNLSMLQRMVLNEMISRKMIGLEADRLGIRISDDALAREISRNDDFRNANGDFDKTLFQQALRQSNQNESVYLKQLRSALKEQVLIGVVNGEDIVPKGYSSYLYAIEGEVRSVDLLTLESTDENFSVAKPSEAQIQDFYDSHQARFTAPQYRTLSLIRLTPEEIGKQVKVNRQEAFSLYNERTESLMIPEKRDILHLLFNTKADAENIYSILRSGKTFDEAIQMITPTNKDAVDLGFVTREQLPPEAAKVFSLGEGEFTEPTESRFGWHIYLVKNVKERSVTPFTEIQESLENEVLQHKMEVRLQESLEQLEDALAGSDSLEAAAKLADMQIFTSEPVSQDGRGIDNQVIFPLDKNQQLLTIAFQLPEGERSDLIQQADGGYFVFKVLSVTPQRQRTLDEVRGQVIEAWTAQELAKAHEAFASELSAKLAKSDSLLETQSILSKIKGEKTEALKLRRNGAIINQDGLSLPNNLVQNIFSLKTVGTPTTVEKNGSDFVVAVLREITPAPDAKSSAEADQQLRALRRKLRNEYKNEILEEYITYLRTRYPVQINETLLLQQAERQE